MANFKGDAQTAKAIIHAPIEAPNFSATEMHTDNGIAALRDQAANNNETDTDVVRELETRIEHKHLPERRINSNAVAAHGEFQLYESQSELTTAGFLQNSGTITPVFVRFSTLANKRNVGDCTRNPRGFAVRFFTEEGDFDLVGSNVPVFYSQDGAHFADLIRAVKPEVGMPAPYGAANHNKFWEVISLTPESTHAILWAMSDRVLPRSFAMMEGFGVHTFRFTNADGHAFLAKFHWKPVLGVQSLVWDEAVKLAAKDPDFHLRHLWELIEQKKFPEWELGVQIVAEEDRYMFGFDLLDTTKIIPESLVPVQLIGKLRLTRNPENYYSEIEKVNFCGENIIPGIELNGCPEPKEFSSLDSSMSQLCSANFNQLPIHRSRAIINKMTRDLQLRELRPEAEGEARFALNQPSVDHYTQATLFWCSQSDWEQKHIVAAFCFELAKVTVPQVRERVVCNLARVDSALAARVADGLGISSPAPIDQTSSTERIQFAELALSSAHTRKKGITGRCIAVLLANGFERERLMAMCDALIAGGAAVKFISPRLGEVKCNQGQSLQVDNSLATVGSVMFDAVYIPGGHGSVDLLCKDANAVLFVKEAYKHGKAIAASNEGGMLITRAARSSVMADVFKGPGVISAGPNTVTEDFINNFVAAVARHRFSERPDMDAIVA